MKAAVEKIVLFLAACVISFCLFGAAQAGQVIKGAGATFPYPLYTGWAIEYARKTGVKVNYQAIGSSAGIKLIKAGKVDFAASDIPLSQEELKEAGLMQFPMAIGGVVPVVNLNGVYTGELRLTPDVLADIYLGDIKQWDDQRIAELNPSFNMPHSKITVVHRSDGSGTTRIFTNYLSKVSGKWRKKVGFGTEVSWPAGIAEKGNEGVAIAVESRKNSIGYVEYAYALRSRLKYTKLKNKSGVFVEPYINSFMAAAASADWENSPGYSVNLTDQDRADAWPITGATFVLVRKNPDNCTSARGTLEFFGWALKNGGEIAEVLVYMPVPEHVYEFVEKSWAKEIRCDGKAVWGKGP